MKKHTARRRLSGTVRKGNPAPFPFAWVFPVLLFVVATAAYWPALHGQPIWDDDAHMTRPELRSLGGLSRIWIEPGATQQYYPLVHSIFWLQQKLWGAAVLPCHLLNLALHLSAALLLYSILRKLRVPGAWLAAAVFALHPVHVESVAWISELKNTLSVAGALAAVAAYLRFDTSRGKAPYYLALLFFSLGLLAKTVIATVPFALLVLFWWQRGRISWRRDVIPLLPFLLAGIAASLFTVWMERTHIGAEGAGFQFSLIDRCLIAGRAFWFYLFKLIWPVKLTFVYPRWEISSAVPWQYLYPLSAIVLLVLAWLARRTNRAPLAALLLFAGMLFPALGFVNVFPFIYSFVADHFQYLGSVALISSGAAVIVLGVEKLRGTKRTVGYALCGLLPLGLAGLTWRQAHSYVNAETLYRDTLALNPTAWMAHNNLANLLFRTGRRDEAITHYEAALQLRSGYVEAHYNLCNALLTRSEIEPAIGHCEAALALDPRSFEAHNNLGNALRQKRMFPEAISHYEVALTIRPRTASAENNLAWILATCPDPDLRDPQRAVTIAQAAVEHAKDVNPVMLRTLSAAYAQNGDFREALKAAERALQLAEAQGDSSAAQYLKSEIPQLRALAAERAEEAAR